MTEASTLLCRRIKRWSQLEQSSSFSYQYKIVSLGSFSLWKPKTKLQGKSVGHWKVCNQKCVLCWRTLDLNIISQAWGWYEPQNQSCRGTRKEWQRRFRGEFSNLIFFRGFITNEGAVQPGPTRDKAVSDDSRIQWNIMHQCVSQLFFWWGLFKWGLSRQIFSLSSLSLSTISLFINHYKCAQVHVHVQMQGGS